MDEDLVAQEQETTRRGVKISVSSVRPNGEAGLEFDERARDLQNDVKFEEGDRALLYHDGGYHQAVVVSITLFVHSRDILYELECLQCRLIEHRLPVDGGLFPYSEEDWLFLNSDESPRMEEEGRRPVSNDPEGAVVPHPGGGRVQTSPEEPELAESREVEVVTLD